MSAPPAPASWSDLVAELDCWHAAGRLATLWWRDDDAGTATAALDRLVRIADGVPLTLAVIPAAAGPELAAWRELAAERGHRLGIIQHGWQHRDHAGNGKKSEFPAGRSGPAAADDLAAGRQRLVGLFGAAALPVLAPPWNRFDDSLLRLLPEAGIAALSRLGSRRTKAVAAGVVEVNVHADLVAWKAGRGFLGTAAALALIAGHLRARRQGAADPAEPTGILTHHLVQEAAAEAFLAELLALTRRHPAVRWLDAAEIFAPAAGAEAGA